MNVRELIALLEQESPEALVVIPSEFSTYSPLDHVENNISYRAETTWCGEVAYEYLTPELEAEGIEKEDLFEDGVKAIILHPIN